ncbi:NAD-dependent epimerase/dehydratase family protein [Candidatus Pelagibacter sp. HIMB1485]|uniref:NAD-dependent epimerase/dehydratase family protein n=1 Tax=Candidatus Pelagibacter sp. HIMB1485 TaxID=3415415 RepID=UPI003F835075
MNKNIILITGGAGFIGSSLIKHFLKLKLKEKIISIDNYYSGSVKNHIKSTQVKYIKGENKNIETILKPYKKKIKIIFHFGEFSRIYQSFKYYKKCFEYNVQHSSKVIDFAKNNNIKLIYSATSSNLGNDGKDENLSPYAWTKSKNIELIKNYNKWFGLKYELVYFYNVYGPGQIKNSKMAAVIGIFEEQYKKKQPLTVVKPGNQRRDFTHVEDIVNGCFLAWKKGNQNEYMLGTKKTYTIKEIAKFFNSKIKYIPSRPGERFGSTITNNNAKKILGYKSKIDIKDYINNFISQN